MKLLLSSLQLASLCAISSWSVSSELVVTQSEDVTVEEGQTANMSCCWTNDNNRTKVTWKRNTTSTTKHEAKFEIVKPESCSFLTIKNTTKDHEGTYFCDVVVDIPILLKGSGNGTVLTVKSKNETTSENKNSDDGTNASVFTIIGLVIGASILLVTLICFCCRRRKRDQAARVIYETPHFDSETPDSDKDSTGSMGSSQWCQVQLYESVDYFERTEAEKSG
ncbi:uncharacterized protein [Eucyclogobius newberryi]|uniref:uncharacterized protein n=1 Tax=Eucyclogobius newberryi TaxID=166745 RepID=UPI003B5B1FE4